MEPSTSTAGEVGGANTALDLLAPSEAAQAADQLAKEQQASGTSPDPTAKGGGGVLGWLFGGLTGVTDFLPNAGLVLLGVVLGVGALLISQKETVVKVAAKAGEL